MELLDPAKDIEATPVTEFPGAHPRQGRLRPGGSRADPRLRRKSRMGSRTNRSRPEPTGHQPSRLRDAGEGSAQHPRQRQAARLCAGPQTPRRSPAVSPSAPWTSGSSRSAPVSCGQAPAGPQPGNNNNSEANKQKAKEINELITKLDEIVKQQRTYTSDVFAFRASCRSATRAKLEELNQTGRHPAPQRGGHGVHNGRSNPVVTADDIALLSAAGDQLRDSSRAIWFQTWIGRFSKAMRPSPHCSNFARTSSKD